MLKKKKIVEDFGISTQSYFKDISKYSSLSREEETTLWRKYKLENDLVARDKIIKSNLKFVVSVAKSYQGLGLSYPDLIAEGNYGLMRAMEKFDYEKGYKTISYSVWWIRQSILEALKERNGLNAEDLPEDNEEPFDNPDYEPIKNDNEPFCSGDSERHTLSDVKDTVSQLMDCLDEREQKIIMLYFGLGGAKEITLEEIGKELNLTKERVRQIKEKAMRKLRSEAIIIV